MGFILDAKSASLYEAWSRSEYSRAYQRMVELSIRTMLEPRPGETVLDIGCGEGNHLQLFRNLGLATAGVDASPYMITKAGERLGTRSDLRVGWAEDLPFEDNQFDLAVLIHTLEFLDHPVESLREAGRVARRKVFVSVINSLSWVGMLSRFRAFYRDSYLNRLKFFNIWELKSLARMAFGDAPMEWVCIRMEGGRAKMNGGAPGTLWNSNHWPFGFFLGLSISPYYSLRTVQHPLEVAGKTQGALVKGITTMSSDFFPGKKSGNPEQPFPQELR